MYFFCYSRDFPNFVFHEIFAEFCRSLNFYRFIYLLIYLFIHSFSYLFLHLFIYFFTYLFIFLFIHNFSFTTSLQNSDGGILRIVVERRDYLNDFDKEDFFLGTFSHNISSENIPETVYRVFRYDILQWINWLIEWLIN